VVVSDPRKTKAIASARIKNDKLDAHMLAQLLRADLLATVYVSPPEYRELKELLRHRVRLVRDKRRMKNRIHNLLAKNNIKLAVKDVFSRKRITKAGYKKAVVATAHRLLQFAFYVLRDQRPYQEQLQPAA
jgi:transposase